MDSEERGIEQDEVELEETVLEDEIQSKTVIPKLVSTKKARKEKLCAVVFTLGLCLVLGASVVMIPTALLDVGFDSVIFFLDKAETGLQSSGVDALQAQLDKVDFDTIEGSQRILAIKISYEISDFVIESFYINFGDTDLTLHTRSMDLDSKHNEISIRFNWEYSEDLSGVSDHGTGVASTTNLHLQLSFKLHSLSSVQVTYCDVKLKDLDVVFETNSDATSWLYDSATNLFSSTVSDRIETNICEQLDDKIFSF